MELSRPASFNFLCTVFDELFKSDPLSNAKMKNVNQVICNGHRLLFLEMKSRLSGHKKHRPAYIIGKTKIVDMGLWARSS